MALGKKSFPTLSRALNIPLYHNLPDYNCFFNFFLPYVFCMYTHFDFLFFLFLLDLCNSTCLLFKLLVSIILSSSVSMQPSVLFCYLACCRHVYSRANLIVFNFYSKFYLFVYFVFHFCTYIIFLFIFLLFSAFLCYFLLCFHTLVLQTSLFLVFNLFSSISRYFLCCSTLNLFLCLFIFTFFFLFQFHYQ